MTQYIHYRFVVSRPQGLLELGQSFYELPIRRGEVVTLDTTLDGPDGKPLPCASYLVEQVAHALRVRPPEAEADDAHKTPIPCSSVSPTVYLRLLDESGQVIPTDSGAIPGVLAPASPASPAAPAPPPAAGKHPAATA